MSKSDKNRHNSRDDSLSDGSRSRSHSRNNRKVKHNSSRSPEKIDHDSLSIYIGNVDYSATEEELRDTFLDCGEIVRVTIIKNMKTGHPKGAAFIEFTDKEGVNAAMNLNGKEVKGRQMIVTMKKPRPDPRDRDRERERDRDRDRDRFSNYDRLANYPRRAMPRSAQIYPSAYQGPYRGPYGGGVIPRAGYFPDPRDPYDSRRLPIPIEPHLQASRYDPYRRPEYYDPYMQIPRGMHPSHYYPSDPRKMNADLRGDPRFDSRTDPRMDPRNYRSDPRDEFRGDPRLDPRYEQRPEPRGDSRGHHKSDPRIESKNYQRNEHKGELRSDLRFDTRGDPRGYHRNSEQTYSSRR